MGARYYEHFFAAVPPLLRGKRYHVSSGSGRVDRGSATESRDLSQHAPDPGRDEWRHGQDDETDRQQAAAQQIVVGRDP